MQIRRKTNLFNIYKDNKFCAPQFITFSNYAESMTGNHLSTNTKMFPSGFICMNIPKLNDSTSINTEDFYKKCLVAHYENKLAFLRDYITDQDTENLKIGSLRPLDYLIRSIKDFDSSSTIVHIGDIVEQNYNGIYSDMLLTINVPENEYSYKIIEDSKWSSNKPIDYNTYVGNKILYGWCEYEKLEEHRDATPKYVGPSKFDSTNVILDDSTYYYIGTKYESINISTISPSTVTPTSTVITTNPNPLKFNVIVPLFNIYNIDENVSNSNNGITSYESNNNIDLSICDNANYIPYGVWFAGINNYVTLNRNTNIDTSDIVQPSWSLVLSSQFSAFPYSRNYSTNSISNNSQSEKVDTKYIDVYHNTFASVLTEQANLIDLLNKQNTEISYIRNEITTLKRMIINK